LKTLHDNEDTLFGDAGDDALDGGAGIDYGLGGPDFDTCVNLETVVECEA
jgi:Ca2+-binding RTX toxin-like protein